MLSSAFRFGRGITFDVDEWRYKRDLKSNLFAAQAGRAGLAFHQADRLVEVLDSLDIR